MKTGMVTSENDFFNKKGGRALSNSTFKTSYSHDYFSMVSFNVLLLLLQAGFELECKKQSKLQFSQEVTGQINWTSFFCSTRDCSIAALHCHFTR